jgi:hypothetical protein
MQANTYMAKASDIILYPSDVDVIFGRERPIFEHPGNRRFRVTIAMNVKRYESSKTRQGKSKIVQEVYSSMREEGIRFLKPCATGIVIAGYYEVDDQVARNKVAHAIRDARSKYNSTSLFRDAISPQYQQQLENDRRYLQQRNGNQSSTDVARQVSIDRPGHMMLKAQHDCDDFEPTPLHEICNLDCIEDDQESKVLDDFSDIPLVDIKNFLTTVTSR